MKPDRHAFHSRRRSIAPAEYLARFIREYRVTQVVDLSSIATVDCTRTCAELRTNFLCASLEERPGQGTVPSNEAIARLLPLRRLALSRGRDLVGRGGYGHRERPAVSALDAFADRVGVPPTLEIGSVYRIPTAARRALTAHPDWNTVAAWLTRGLCLPADRKDRGPDRDGVLLCSRRFGELWMGFETNVPTGLAFGTNATQLQVAACVVAGW